MRPSDHRRILERLVAEYAALLSRRSEFGALPSAIMLAAQARAIAFHCRYLNLPPSILDRMNAEVDALTVELRDAQSSLRKVTRNLEELAAVDPELANRLLREFAETGRFMLAERASPFLAPQRMQ